MGVACVWCAMRSPGEWVIGPCMDLLRMMMGNAHGFFTVIVASSQSLRGQITSTA